MMEILIEKEANQIREKYVSCFINTNMDYDVDNIKKRIMCRDGMCYTGYLWDCLKNKYLVSEKECISYIENIENIYIFWDIHSQDRIFIPDYWKYPKDAVLKLRYKEFIENINNLPEDIYIVDDTFEWSIALTHETDAQQNRYCLFAYV